LLVGVCVTGVPASVNWFEAVFVKVNPAGSAGNVNRGDNREIEVVRVTDEIASFRKKVNAVLLKELLFESRNRPGLMETELLETFDPTVITIDSFDDVAPLYPPELNTTLLPLLTTKEGGIPVDTATVGTVG
jgi:hypothetical protein